MNALQFASALFGKFLEASISASVLAAVTFLLQLALRKRLSAAWRFALLTPVLIRLLVPVLPESSFSIFNAPRWFRLLAPSQPQVTVEIKKSGLASPMVPESMELPSIERASVYIPGIKKPALTTMEKLTLLWLGVSGFLLLRLVIGVLWLNLRLRKGRRLPSPFLLRVFLSSCEETRTAWKPRMIETNLVDSPGLFGFLRPTLLLPRGIDSELSESELRHIFLHELAHLKRGDLITNWFMSIGQALHWFNPVVWLLLRRMRLERELACDALALRFTESEGARPYGETILKLLDRVKARAALPAMVGILEEKQTAKSRLEQIATYTRSNGFRKMGIVLLVSTAVLGLSNAQTKRPVQAESHTSQNLPVPTNGLHDDFSGRGIAALEAEYGKQKTLVEQARGEVEGLRSALGISDKPDDYRDHDSCCGSPEEHIRILEHDHVAAEAEYVHLSEVLKQLKGKTREELRKIVPVVYPNSELNRLLNVFHQTEQQRAALLSDFDKNHPDVQRLDSILKKINGQIDEQIDGSLLGLEVKARETKALSQQLKESSESARKEEAEKRAHYEPYFTAKRNLENQQRILDTIYMRILAEKVEAKVSENNTLIKDARILMELGKLDEATAKLEKVLANDPNNQAAQQYLSQIRERRSLAKNSTDRVTVPTTARSDSAESDNTTPLYTRTYKVDPVIFLKNIERFQGSKSAIQENEGGSATNRMQNLVRSYFESKGVDFETPTVDSVRAGENPSAPHKAIFFNDRTGVLYVRATLADMDRIESAVQAANIKTHEVEFYCRLISLPTEAGEEFIRKWSENPIFAVNAVGWVTTVMNDDQLKQTVEALKQGSNTVSISNRTVTITGRLDDPQFSNVVASLGGPTNALRKVSKGADATHVFNTKSDLIESAEKIKGSQVLGGVSLLAFTGQTAVIKVAAGPKMEVTGNYDTENKLHVRADVTIPKSPEPITFSAHAAVHEGEAFVFARKAKLSPETDHIPVLGDIPTLGPVFRSSEEKVILFFIVPKAR